MTRTTQPGGRLSGAGKWLTAAITSAAALTALLVNARNLGVAQWLGLADYAARHVWVTPRADTLLAVGDSAALAATVTDKLGVALTSASLAWRSADTTVATVDSAGTVVARGPGTTRVTVAVRDLVAEASLTVQQRPTRVEVPGDTLVRVLEGDTVPLIAHALDARGHRIRGLLPHWRSADTLTVATDSLGRAVALAPGWTSLTASVPPHEARIVVRVDLAPAAVALLTGGGQRAAAGGSLAQPVVVRVLSRGSLPVPGITVAFTPADGEGQVAPSTVVADHDGRARTTWTLSPRPGRQYLMASAAMLDSTLTVSAEADPIRGNTRIESLAGSLSGRVGQLLPEPVAVRVTDTAGAVLADVPVGWTALDGGSVEPRADRTDSLGEARVNWTLGRRAGPQRLRIQVGNPRTLPAITTVAAAASAPATTITLLSGQSQTGTAGAALAKAVVVAVRDTFGNGVAAVPLAVRAVQGAVADPAPVTDSSGRAAVRWILGPSAGTQSLEVRAEGVDSTVRVVARVRAGAPADLTFRDAPTRGTGGTAIPLTVSVSDAWGNTVPAATVLFTVRSGTLSASQVRTDADGRAATRWTPARLAGDQVITASVRGSKLEVKHTVRISVAAARR